MNVTFIELIINIKYNTHMKCFTLIYFLARSPSPTLFQLLWTIFYFLYCHYRVSKAFLPVLAAQSCTLDCAVSYLIINQKIWSICPEWMYTITKLLIPHISVCKVIGHVMQCKIFKELINKVSCPWSRVINIMLHMNNEAMPELNIDCIYLFLVVSDTWIEEPRLGLRPLKMNSEKKYKSRSLRLNNNNISDLSDLHLSISHFLAEPLQLAWLDLSFNRLAHIDHVSSLFPSFC